MNTTMHFVRHIACPRLTQDRSDVLLTVHFPFLSLDRSFLAFFFEDDDCAPFSSADTEALAEGFDEVVPSSPDAEDEEDVEDALDEGGALLAPRLGLLELFAFAFVPVEAPLALDNSCGSSCGAGSLP